jgi:hypothetical protein
VIGAIWTVIELAFECRDASQQRELVNRLQRDDGRGAVHLSDDGPEPLGALVGV